MFLLFDKVYVKPEYRMDMERPRGIITPALGDVMLEGIETKFRNLGESYFNVDSYEDLVGSDKQFPNDSEFFEFLLSKGSMDIFVNSATYNKLFVKWIKLMYPTITKEDAFRIYNANTTASKLITRQDFTWGSDNEGVDSQKELAKAFEYLTKDQFQGLFKTVTVDENSTLTGKIRAKAPIELLIANKLNGNNTYDESLGIKMYAILSKKVLDEALFIRSSLLQNINKDWVSKLLGVSYAIDEDLFALEGTNDTIDFILNNQSIDNVKVDIADFRQKMFEASGTEAGDDDSTLSKEVIKIVQNSSTKLSSNDIDTVIDKEIDSALSAFEIEDRLKVNVLLLNYFYKLKKTSSATLANFSIG